MDAPRRLAETALSAAEGREGLDRRWRAAPGGRPAGAESAQYTPVEPQDHAATAHFVARRNSASFRAASQALRARWSSWLSAFGTRSAAASRPAPARRRPATEAARKLWRDSSPRCRRTCGAGSGAGRASSRAATAARRARQGLGHVPPEFALVPAPDVLPAGADALADWALFETRLEVMERAAHRFTVLVPSSGPLAEEQALARHMEWARVVRLEKPAHGVRRAPLGDVPHRLRARDWTRCWGRAAARLRWRHN